VAALDEECRCLQRLDGGRQRGARDPNVEVGAKMRHEVRADAPVRGSRDIAERGESETDVLDRSEADDHLASLRDANRSLIRLD